MDVLLSDDSRYRTFLAICHCGFSKELKLSDFPVNEKNPFHYPCSCGKSCKVFGNLRQSARKKVSLIGRVVLSSDHGKADWFGMILDLSKLGMLIKTDPIRNIAGDESLSATILLDDRRKTKLQMRCRVRRVLSESNCLLLGIKFRSLTALQQQVLERYLAA